MFRAQREQYRRGLETLGTWELRKLETLFRQTDQETKLQLTREELAERGEDAEGVAPVAELRFSLEGA